MPAINSYMVPLGTKAAHFVLKDARTDELVSLEKNKSSIATVIVFICNHCPYVKHIQDTLVKVALDYQAKGIHFIAISSNDVEQYPADSFENMRIEAANHHYPFPYLYDPTQEVAKAYKAACTPDFFVFDKDLACVYRGCFDESTPGNNKAVTGECLIAVLDSLLLGQPVSSVQKPSIGCSIKWKQPEQDK
jgi:thiol-disulfide isomerase/thioredoxin